jgi:glucokinase
MLAPSLALDIGGTKIAAGLIDANGQVLHQNRQPTPRNADPDQGWAAAQRTIADALAAVRAEDAVR